jgi:hypothetical protein
VIANGYLRLDPLGVGPRGREAPRGARAVGRPINWRQKWRQTHLGSPALARNPR